MDKALMAKRLCYEARCKFELPFCDNYRSCPPSGYKDFMDNARELVDLILRHGSVDLRVLIEDMDESDRICTPRLNPDG